LTTTNPLDGRWAAASGPAGEDIAYRTQSLKFTGMEIALDETVSIHTLFRLWLYAAVASFAVFSGFFMLAYVVGNLGASSAGETAGGSAFGSNDATSGLSAFVALTEVGWLLAFLTFWLVLLLVRLREPVAEWKALIDGKAAAAESSYSAIYYSLARRRIPVRVTASRVRSDVLGAESVSHRLLITERSYIAYVSVFAFGTSLYVGWTMWRSRRGVTLVGQFVKDLIGGMVGRSGIVNQMLRTERVRAAREALHSAVREGVDAAVEGISMQISTTFGHDIPIEGASAMLPSDPADPSRQPIGPVAVSPPATHTAG